jgi:hypothetical protein
MGKFEFFVKIEFNLIRNSNLMIRNLPFEVIR